MLRRHLLALVLALPLAAAAQEAFTNRSTDMKERAEAGARTLKSLAVNTPVKVISKGGGWTRVEAGGQSGWVQMFHLRYPGSTEKTRTSSGGGDFLSSIGSTLTGQRSNPNANLATTGVRGFSQEELKNATPDPEALRKLQSYRADRAAAERFARDAKLAAVKVDDPESAPAPSKGGRR